MESTFFRVSALIRGLSTGSENGYSPITLPAPVWPAAVELAVEDLFPGPKSSLPLVTRRRLRGP